MSPIVLEPESFELQLFEFEVVTITRRTEPKPSDFLRNLSQQSEQLGEWVTQRQRRQAQRWLEQLGDETQIEMVAIPAGTFLMGSPTDEPERAETEEPQHKANVPSFLMGRYPVTQAQWQFVARLDQVNRELDLEPTAFKGDSPPVENVSWYDAIEFCDRLTQFTSRDYRLPTETEWEYACRAGTTTPFHFGETITTDLANYHGGYIYNDGSQGEYRKATTPVDHFGIANAFGLCDMHGNVWEWCQDHRHGNYKGAPSDGSAWLSEGKNDSRVMRGGSFIDFPRSCRSASRSCNLPDDRYDFIGFRVVCLEIASLSWV